ncbi:MAG: PIG-L family deacetylase [Bacilli bacterium]
MKILIIILSLLIGFTFYNTSYKVNKSLDNIDFSKVTKLMITAHPDDESLWGGAHLLEDDYLVVCITCGSSRIRVKEFKNAMHKTNDQFIMLGYPDLTLFGASKWKKEYNDIYNDLKKIINYKKWDIIVTHNKDGEYGHPHHKLTSKIVTSLTDNNLYYFGQYYKKDEVQGLKIDSNLLKQKKELLKVYNSQAIVRTMFKHMNSYENWILIK